MPDDANKLATKDGLQQLEDKLCSRLDGHDARMDAMDARFDKLETRMDGLESTMQNVKSELLSHMENIKDQIIRGFQLTEESIRKDCAHVDEVAAIDSRLTKVETQLRQDRPA